MTTDLDGADITGICCKCESAYSILMEVAFYIWKSKSATRSSYYFSLKDASIRHFLQEKKNDKRNTKLLA